MVGSGSTKTPPLPEDGPKVYLKTRILPLDKPIQISGQSGAVEHIVIGSFGEQNIIGD